MSDMRTAEQINLEQTGRVELVEFINELLERLQPEAKPVVRDDAVRFRCSNCGGQAFGVELLRSPSPFDWRDWVLGCPYCRSVNTMKKA
jgi:hypothetical protein